jgi:hypothetical protein
LKLPLQAQQNNAVAADCQQPLVLRKRLLAAAEQHRYADYEAVSLSTKFQISVVNQIPIFWQHRVIISHVDDYN